MGSLATRIGSRSFPNSGPDSPGPSHPAPAPRSAGPTPRSHTPHGPSAPAGALGPCGVWERGVGPADLGAGAGWLGPGESGPEFGNDRDPIRVARLPKADPKGNGQRQSRQRAAGSPTIVTDPPGHEARSPAPRLSQCVASASRRIATRRVSGCSPPWVMTRLRADASNNSCARSPSPVPCDFCVP